MSWAELIKEKFLEIKNSNDTVDLKNISYAQLMSMLEISNSRKFL